MESNHLKYNNFPDSIVRFLFSCTKLVGQKGVLVEPIGGMRNSGCGAGMDSTTQIPGSDGY